MTATTIDELVVALGLDPAEFKKGTKDAEEILKRFQTVSVKAAKESQAQAKHMTESIGAVRDKVLGLFAAFTAGASMRDFFRDVSGATVESHNLAQSLGVSTQALNRWEAASRYAGGTADGIRQTFQGLNNELQDYQLYHRMGAHMQVMAAQGVSLLDEQGNVLTPDKAVRNITRYLQGIHDTRERFTMGRRFGIADGALPLITGGTQAEDAYLGEAGRNGVGPTRQQEQALRDLARAQAEADSSYQSLRQTIAAAFAPEMTMATNAIRGLTNEIRHHPRVVKAAFAGVGAAALALGAAFSGPLVVGFAAANAGALTMAGAFAGVTAAGTFLFDDISSWLHGGKARFADFYQTVADVWHDLERDGARAWSHIKAGGTEAWEAIRSLFVGDSDEIRSQWGALTGDLSGSWESFVSKIKSGGPEVLDALKQAFREALAWLRDAFLAAIHGRSAVEHGAARSATAVGEGVRHAAQDVGHYVADRASAIRGAFLPRGIRNNNPGNLNFMRQSGAVLENGQHARFAAFATMDDGIRALRDQLGRYGDRGQDSIRSIIAKYAPAGENNTAAYIASLSRSMGVSADAHLNMHDPAVLRRMIAGISRIENGAGYLEQGQIDRAIGYGAPARMASNTTHIENHVTVHAPSGNPRAIAQAVAQRLNPQGMGMHANLGVTA
ncbi:hypothetical protein [Nguyenibacter vanlangensis]|uniref:hypothetical protein n=1 Tax=Nguyenibacter vanlangensis TaxID=1216886 RepID=UPI002938FEC0|nr:hypothetical protein [Nguyenibacter vanlangensis]